MSNSKRQQGFMNKNWGYFVGGGLLAILTLIATLAIFAYVPRPTAQQAESVVTQTTPTATATPVATVTSTPTPRMRVEGNKAIMNVPGGASIEIISKVSPTLQIGTCEGTIEPLGEETLGDYWRNVFNLGIQPRECEVFFSALEGEKSSITSSGPARRVPVQIRPVGVTPTTQPTAGCTPVPGARRAPSSEDMKNMAVEAAMAELLCR